MFQQQLDITMFETLPSDIIYTPHPVTVYAVCKIM